MPHSGMITSREAPGEGPRHRDGPPHRGRPGVAAPSGASHLGSHVVVPPGQPAPRVGPTYLCPDPEIKNRAHYEEDHFLSLELVVLRS
jgi:hypothetical protein